ncbi:MAG: hypothetical protein NT027_05425 [Proteobacteria bacterium]|nr:hypothetical protein [Pseudomonadota bacterium]
MGTTVSKPVQVDVPAEWRARCDVTKISQQNRGEYIPLHDDYLKAFGTVKEVDFTIYFAVGWDLYEFMRPKEFSHELLKEMLLKHKEYPTATRICVKKSDFGRYEKLVEKYRRDKFIAASKGASLKLETTYRLYSELSVVSHTMMRGYLDHESYLRISRVASSAVMGMPSTKDCVGFILQIVGHEPALYDHGACTALLTSCIAWNSLKLGKREAKLAVQSALMHDIERNCAYLGKPSDPFKISDNAIKDLEKALAAKQGFHEVNLQVMKQYRERYDGRGYPERLQNEFELGYPLGIVRPARIVSFACAFSEYMLKRQEKAPLSMETILRLIDERVKKGEFDPKVVSAFLTDLATGAVRKPTDVAKDDDAEGDSENDEEEFDLDSSDYM